MWGGGWKLSYILAPQRGTWGSNKPAKVWLRNVQCAVKCRFAHYTHSGEEVEEPNPHPGRVGGRRPRRGGEVWPILRRFSMESA